MVNGWEIVMRPSVNGIVWGVAKTVGLNVIVSALPVVFASLIASRSDVSPAVTFPLSSSVVKSTTNVVGVTRSSSCWQPSRTRRLACRLLALGGGRKNRA